MDKNKNNRVNPISLLEKSLNEQRSYAHMAEGMAEGSQVDNQSADDSISEVKQERDKAYDERNKLLLQRLRFYSKLGLDVGWKNPESDPTNQYFIIFVPSQDSDKFGKVQQMGWHVHKDDVDVDEYDFLQEINQEYDGHSTDEKYERLDKLEDKLVKETYNMTVAELVNIVSKISSVSGEINAYANIKSKGQNLSEEVGRGLAKCSDNLSDIVQNLRDLQNEQYISD